MEPHVIIAIVSGAVGIIIVAGLLLLLCYYCCCVCKPSNKSQRQQSSPHRSTTTHYNNTAINDDCIVTIPSFDTNSQNTPTNTGTTTPVPIPSFVTYYNRNNVSLPTIKGTASTTALPTQHSVSTQSQTSDRNNIFIISETNITPQHHTVPIPFHNNAPYDYYNTATISGSVISDDSSDSSSVSDRPEVFVDLHGMRLREAMDAVEEALEDAVSGTTVNIITGRGLHSRGGIPVIKPAVEEYLDDNGYYGYEWKNRGGMVSVAI